LLVPCIDAAQIPDQLRHAGTFQLRPPELL
jgi:hypothetical protein